jgi:hypothetical protein
MKNKRAFDSPDVPARRTVSASVRLLAAVCTLAFVGATAAAEVKFVSTWASPDARGMTFKGKKVGAFVISDDLSLRMSAEEALGRELASRGMQGAPAYRMIPAEELKNVDRAKAWLQRDDVAAVVALRPVSVTEEQRPNVAVWSSPMYSTLWGYYPYSWGAVYSVGPPRKDTVIAVELVIFDVATGKLVWGGISEAVNPRTLQTLVADIVKEAAEKIERQFR